MKGTHRLARAAAFVVAGYMAINAAESARADTISAGINACISSSGSYTGGTIDECFVTAVFGTNAYIQDASGGIYLYKGANATYGIPGITVGSKITSLGANSSAGFYYYMSGTQFEYEPSSSTTAYSYGMLAAGTYQSIPASYYTAMTLPTFNSAATQGSSTSAGMQNQLVTLNNITITPATGSTTFATGSYTMTDASGNTGVLYVNAASGLVGQSVPSGAVNVSGVLQDFHNTSELLPRGAYDLAAVPEPSAAGWLAGGVLGSILVARRRRRVRLQ